MVLKKLTDLYEMLKRAEEPKAVVKHKEKLHMCVDKLFDISKKDIDKHLSAEDYLFIQNQKGLCKSTFGGKYLILVKQLKRHVVYFH